MNQIINVSVCKGINWLKESACISVLRIRSMLEVVVFVMLIIIMLVGSVCLVLIILHGHHRGVDAIKDSLI